MASDNKQAMGIGYKAQIEKYGTPISRDLYLELRKYADEHRIRITGFRNFVGDIETIKTVIDDICEIAVDFPEILDKRMGIVLELDYDMNEEDFATTDSGHVIHLNAAYFSDRKILSEAYKESAEKGHFVSNTDWRSVARHEAGHVVENFYGFDIFAITSEILGTNNIPDMLSKLRNEVSLYSAMYLDFREVISESFSGFYGKSGNKFTTEFVNKCIEIKENVILPKKGR